MPHRREHNETGMLDPALRRLSSDQLWQVVASLGHRVVAWSLSGPQNDYWRVHSSLQLLEDQQVTALDCISGIYVYRSPLSVSKYLQACLLSARDPVYLCTP